MEALYVPGISNMMTVLSSMVSRGWSRHLRWNSYTQLLIATGAYLVVKKIVCKVQPVNRWSFFETLRPHSIQAGVYFRMQICHPERISSDAPLYFTLALAN